MECRNKLVDEYIENTPIDRHEKLNQMRNLVFEVVPEVAEGISQKMPSYKLDGKQLMYFYNGKNHVSFFLDKKIMEANNDKIKQFVRCNSGFQIKLNESLPLELMREFILLKVKEIKSSLKKE